MADRERWLCVPGWPGYKASSRGRVKSVPRRLANGRYHGGGLLAQTPDPDGYLYVTLRDGARSRCVHVAVLVLETFDRAKPEGMEACHGRDGHQVNWWPSNLRWGTHRENEQDKRRTEVRNRREVSRPPTAVASVSADVLR